jgi:hypothetical protein
MFISLAAKEYVRADVDKCYLVIGTIFERLFARYLKELGVFVEQGFEDAPSDDGLLAQTVISRTGAAILMSGWQVCVW